MISLQLPYTPAHLLGVGELQVPSSLHVAEGDPSSRYPLKHNENQLD